MSTKLTKLLRSGLQIFTLDDLGVIWGQKSRSATVQSARDYLTSGSLIRLRQGVYALPGVALDRYLIANKLLAPSYVTGLSVLTDAGLSYQYTGKTYSVASYNKTYETASGVFVYSQIKESVLFNSLGLNSLNNQQTATVATVERAITDLIYLTKGRYPFEYLDGIDFDFLDHCAEIYENQTVINKVKTLREQYA